MRKNGRALTNLETQCCIAGGGPAGMMLGYLLARAGVDVIVLEKHADFLRDFRGDTIHPSTLEILGELDLLDQFLTLPHQEMPIVRVTAFGSQFTIADFKHLPTRCKFIAFMPQWDFLRFIAGQGKRWPGFRLLMEHEADDLIIESSRVVGIRGKCPEGEFQIRSALVVGADGRSSVVRQRAGLEVEELGVPIDVLWMRIPKDPSLKEQSLGYMNRGKFMVLIDRLDYFQCGFLIRKGGFEQVRAAGLDQFRDDIVELAPFTAPFIPALEDWDQVKLLTVRIDHLRRWFRTGLLCIGDAAHAMSPAGGVGINLAIQDAVAAANLLTESLKQGQVSDSALAAVQRRRAFPARVIQSGQAVIHRVFLRRGAATLSRIVFWFVRHIPLLPRRGARLIGLGVRPEHVKEQLASDDAGGH